MCVRVRLSDSVVFVIDADFKNFQKAYQKALQHNVLIEVGNNKVINPQQILYAEEIDNVTCQSLLSSERR